MQDEQLQRTKTSIELGLCTDCEAIGNSNGILTCENKKPEDLPPSCIEDEDAKALAEAEMEERRTEHDKDRHVERCSACTDACASRGSAEEVDYCIIDCDTTACRGLNHEDGDDDHYGEGPDSAPDHPPPAEHGADHGADHDEF